MSGMSLHLSTDEVAGDDAARTPVDDDEVEHLASREQRHGSRVDLPEHRLVRAEQQLLPKMKVMEEYLAKNRNFDGSAWGMADFMVASVTYSMWINKFALLEKFPKFKAWLDASVERPAAREARKLRE